MRLSNMVGRRLRAGKRQACLVSIGVVYRPDPDHFSKQMTHAEPIANGDNIYQVALKVLAARDRIAFGNTGHPDDKRSGR